MPAWYNIGTLNFVSLLLGIAAWALPLAAAARPARRGAFTAASFLCCALALVGQILSLGRRVFLGDFSGLEDTMGGTIGMVLILVAVTLALNLAVWKGSQLAEKGADSPAP